MKKIFRVSKQRLTRCPQCARHIFVAARWKETTCHFCDAQLLATARPPSLARGRSRANFIAAGLLSASLGMAACDDTSEPVTDASMSVAPDPIGADAYGLPAEDAMTAEDDATAADAARSLDPIEAPAYGKAPDSED